MFTIYELATGGIRYAFHGDDFLIEAACPEGCSAIPGNYDDALYRVDIEQLPHVAVLKTTVPFALDSPDIEADGVDVATISGLPAGTVGSVGSLEVAETDGAIDFAVDFPGVYEITLRHVLYLDTVVTIAAS